MVWLMSKHSMRRPSRSPPSSSPSTARQRPGALLSASPPRTAAGASASCAFCRASSSHSRRVPCGWRIHCTGWPPAAAALEQRRVGSHAVDAPAPAAPAGRRSAGRGRPATISSSVPASPASAACPGRTPCRPDAGRRAPSRGSRRRVRRAPPRRRRRHRRRWRVSIDWRDCIRASALSRSRSCAASSKRSSAAAACISASRSASTSRWPPCRKRAARVDVAGIAALRRSVRRRARCSARSGAAGRVASGWRTPSPRRCAAGRPSAAPGSLSRTAQAFGYGPK